MTELLQTHNIPLFIQMYAYGVVSALAMSLLYIAYRLNVLSTGLHACMRRVVLLRLLWASLLSWFTVIVLLVDLLFSLPRLTVGLIVVTSIILIIMKLAGTS